MLRFFVLFLVLLNGLYFAWSQGFLRDYGFAPATQAEPHRVTQQIKPEALRILTPTEAQRVQALLAADQAPKECLQVGPFDDAQLATVRDALGAALPSEAWSVETVPITARWIVYMGKFANAEALAKKRAELTALQLSPQVVQNATLEPGLSLGGFDTQAGANNELARLQQRGVRTARVVQERAESQGYVVKLPALRAEWKTRLAEIKPVWVGKPLRACQ